MTAVKKVLVFIAIYFTVLPGAAISQSQDFEHQQFQIGSINYFGYGGLPLQRIRAVVPWHVGDTLTFATFSRTPVEDAISREIGRPPTDVNVTCCDNWHHLEIYIGLPGSTSRAVPVETSRRGNAHLDPQGLRLYQRQDALLKDAVARGAAGEDDSHGYMISKDPSLKAVNLDMRSYALGREHQLESVLMAASNAEDRRAAAWLLGYVQSSAGQVRALSRAITDPDSDVRNNAMRALEVLASSTDRQNREIDLAPFINLLYSGIWTDRNKASLFFAKITDGRDPKVLAELRDKALDPLMEGASWSDVPGHSTPFLVILGRIGKIPDAKLEELLSTGSSSIIIAAAMPTGGSPAH